MAGHLRARRPEKVVHWSVALRSLNHAASARPMGPDQSSIYYRKLIAALNNSARSLRIVSIFGSAGNEKRATMNF